MNRTIHTTLKRNLVLAALLAVSLGTWADNVAKIGGTEYATLQAAVEAATAGSTIELTADIAETVANTSNANSFTIDLGNHTWTYTKSDDDYAALKQDNAGSVITLMNGNITVTEGNGYCVWARNGKVIVESGSFDSNEGSVVSGNVEIKGGTFSHNISDYVADGYVVKTNTTANPITYTVVPKVIVGVSSEITDDTQKTAALSLANNTSIETVTGLGKNESFEINITGVSASTDGNVIAAIFEVTLIDASGSSQSSSSSEITFRLPVSSGIDAGKWANLKHGTTVLPGTTVKEENGSKYVEITTTTFSPFSYEILSDDPVAQIGETKYDNIDAAITAAGTTATTITLLADISDDITIPSGANITLAVGDYTYSGTITNNGTCVLSGGTYTNLPPANCCVGFMPVKNGDGKYNLANSWEIGDNTTISDYSYLEDKGYSVATAKYNRTTGMSAVGSNAATQYGTICLPFDIKAAVSGVTLYKATNISESTLTITEVTPTSVNPITAGTPLIFELGTAATTMSIISSNATINTATPAEAPVSGNLLVGTFVGKSITTDLTSIYYLNGDKFHQAQQLLTVPGYRAYLKVASDPSNQAREISIVREGDDDATGISKVMNISSVTKVFDLNGRKQNGLKHGVNIMRRADGSTTKVIVK